MRNLLLLIFFSFSGYGQIVNYSGVLTDDTGMPIPGVNICIRGTTTCVQSDFDGNYDIKVRVGQELEISYIGMQTRYVKITQGNGKPKASEEVQPILSSDFVNSIKEENDTLQATVPSGTASYSNNTYYLQDVVNIKKDGNNVYSFVNGHDKTRLYIDLYTEFLAGVPMRERSFQNRFAQGRSIGGELAYRGPETNEIFSWGPQLSTLHISGNATPWYPGGDIVPGNGSRIPVFGANGFFRTSTENKTSFSARLDMHQKGDLKLNVTYRSATGNLPEVNNNDLATTLSYSRNHKNHRFNGTFNFNRFEDKLSNTNFLHNKAVFANAVTPAHFDNNAGMVLPDGTPRSFSQLENNPYYLLQNNRDASENTAMSLSVSDWYVNDRLTNDLRVLSQYSDRRTTGGNIPLAAQVAVPDYTDRREKYSLLSIEDDLEYDDQDHTKFGAGLNLKYQQRDLSRQYGLGFDGLESYPGAANDQYTLSKTQERAEAALNLNLAHDLREIVGYDDELNVSVGGNIAASSTYTGMVYGGLSGNFRWNDLLFRRLSLYGSAIARQYEPIIQNNNLYFNSLAYSLEDLKLMRNHHELFAPNATTTTREKVYTAGMSYDNWPLRMSLELYQKKVADIYAPVNTGGTFSWLPAVNYEQKGLEFSVLYDHPRNDRERFSFSHDLHFTAYENKVTGLSRNLDRIPFAGFADVNKNYIEGEPVGAIVGSVYERDAYGNKLIGPDGFPLVAGSPAVIGDPNPDFVLGLSTQANYKDLYVRVGFDWSKGGDLWNGTSQTLDHYGVSQGTAQLRDVTGYVFKGVTQTGQPNMQTVSFYDPSLPVEQNRWVRYGVGGVAEDAIEDATFFRLHNISVGYNGRVPYGKSSLGLVVSVFVNNVFILSKSDTAFANNTLFNSADTSGLDYFNAPLQRMYGLSVAVKF